MLNAECSTLNACLKACLAFCIEHFAGAAMRGVLRSAPRPGRFLICRDEARFAFSLKRSAFTRFELPLPPHALENSKSQITNLKPDGNWLWILFGPWNLRLGFIWFLNFRI
jgi:hypothetical protein